MERSSEGVREGGMDGKRGTKGAMKWRREREEGVEE